MEPNPGYVERREEYRRRWWDIVERCSADPSLDSQALKMANARRWYQKERRIAISTANRHLRDDMLGKHCVRCGFRRARVDYSITATGMIFEHFYGPLPICSQLVYRDNFAVVLRHFSSGHYACVCGSCVVAYKWQAKREAGEFLQSMTKEQIWELVDETRSFRWMVRYVGHRRPFASRVPTDTLVDRENS